MKNANYLTQFKKAFEGVWISLLASTCAVIFKYLRQPSDKVVSNALLVPVYIRSSIKVK